MNIVTPFPLTDTFARFVTGHDYASLPDPVRREAKKAMRDCIGGAIAGHAEPPARIVCGQARDVGGACAVWGGPLRTNADMAALVNGTLAHAHAIDDTNESMRGHPSVAVLPAILAVAEERDASGRDMIAAYAIGVEIAAKLGLAVNDRHARIGWHTTPTLGSVGAAAGVAHLMGLDLAQTRNAIAVSASLASGLRANFGTMTKALMPGVAARNGVLAARLAGAGLTGSADALEAPEGFLDMFCGVEHARPEIAAAALGSPFELERPGIVYKLYPNCSLMHAAIDMALEGRAQNVIHPDDIAAVACSISVRLDAMRLHRAPLNSMEAKFSVEYCLAFALMRNSLGFDAFSGPALDDAPVRALMARVRIEVDSATDPGNGDFATLAIEHRRHPAFTRSRRKPLGHPSNPLSDGQLRAKFTACAEPGLGCEKTRALWEAVGDLENRDARAIGRILTI